MEYNIRKTDEGSFELSQFVPKIIGTFAEEGMAQKVMVLLSENEEHVKTPPVQEGAAQAEPQQTDKEPDMGAAFARIRSGEKLNKVASDIGMPFAQLRGKWSAEKRREAAQERAQTSQDTTAPAVLEPRPDFVETFKAGAAAAMEMTACECGKHFTPSDPNQTQCARCAKG